MQFIPSCSRDRLIRCQKVAAATRRNATCNDFMGQNETISWMGGMKSPANQFSRQVQEGPIGIRDHGIKSLQSFARAQVG